MTRERDLEDKGMTINNKEEGLRGQEDDHKWQGRGTSRKRG
jgi:hypothetical protein